MEKKCKKFESLFIFSEEKEFAEHIKNCEICKNEKEKFDKISKLIKKAKPFYFAEKKHSKNLIAACALFLVTFSTGVFMVFNHSPLGDEIKYGQTLCAEDYGFPVDSYGLIMVDEWILMK